MDHRVTAILIGILMTAILGIGLWINLFWFLQTHGDGRRTWLEQQTFWNLGTTVGDIPRRENMTASTFLDQHPCVPVAESAFLPSPYCHWNLKSQDEHLGFLQHIFTRGEQHERTWLRRWVCWGLFMVGLILWVIIDIGDWIHWTNQNIPRYLSMPSRNVHLIIGLNLLFFLFGNIFMEITIPPESGMETLQHRIHPLVLPCQTADKSSACSVFMTTELFEELRHASRWVDQYGTKEWIWVLSFLASIFACCLSVLYVVMMFPILSELALAIWKNPPRPTFTPSISSSLSSSSTPSLSSSSSSPPLPSSTCSSSPPNGQS